MWRSVVEAIAAVAPAWKVPLGIFSRLQPFMVEVAKFDECIMIVRKKHTMGFGHIIVSNFIVHLLELIELTQVMCLSLWICILKKLLFKPVSAGDAAC